MTPPDPVLALVRPEILALAPYSSARKEASGGRVWLDANENPETPSVGQAFLNRYPDPQPPALLQRLAGLYGVPAAQLLVTRGSDEGIDLLLRTFCRAGRDAILITPPTYGMYVVAAGIQGASVVTVPLVRDQGYGLDADAVLRALTPAVKLVFLCSPNNPTGALLARDQVRQVLRGTAGRAMVVVDEAYVDFSGQPSLAAEIAEFPHLVVLRTLSKAFGLAGARVGTTIAAPFVVQILQKVIAPYPVPSPVLAAALAALEPEAISAAQASVATLRSERQRLATAMRAIASVRRIWPSDANYLLIEVPDATRAMAMARGTGVIWRDRSKDVPNSIRITVGTAAENDETLEVLTRV